MNKKQSKSPKKDIRQNFDNANEKLLVLRDENIHLKEKKVRLEEELKLIATKMKRTITTLKKDRIVSSGGTISSRIDVDLD